MKDLTRTQVSTFDEPSSNSQIYSNTGGLSGYFFFEERNSLTVNKHRLGIRYGNIVLDNNASILAKNKLVSKIKLTEIYYAYYAI